MTLGLAATFRVLTKTKNEAAVPLLIPAMDSPHVPIQEGALRAVLYRYCVPGQKEVIRRLHTINDRWRQILDEQHGRMTAALRDAVLSKDDQMCLNGCQAALWFHEYDLMATLINAAEDEANPHRDLAARTLLQLAELLYDELTAPRDYTNRRDPRMVRQHIVTALEQSVVRFTKHRRGEMLEAFLMLVNRDNAALKQMLMDPRHGAYLALVDFLSHSQRNGVIRLALSYLDDSHAPSAAINLVAHRSDELLVDCLLRKVGHEPSAVVAQNLKRIDSIPWLQGDLALLDRMDDAAQHAAVQLAIRSGIPRQHVYRLLEHLVSRGKVGGRRAAAAALATFNGATANSLCIDCLRDEDAEVQANAVAQLRQRGIPGALSRLISLLDSPHEVVRNAARHSLTEFTFKRYLSTFDILEEQVRESTGRLVARVDAQATPLLIEELTARSRTRRLRAMAMAVAMGFAPRLEEHLIHLLKDEDHVVRTEAARALGQCETAPATAALREALIDRSYAVQEAVETSLRMITAAMAQRTADGEHQSTAPAAAVAPAPAPIHKATEARP